MPMRLLLQLNAAGYHVYGPLSSHPCSLQLGSIRPTSSRTLLLNRRRPTQLGPGLGGAARVYPQASTGPSGAQGVWASESEI